MAKWQGRKAMAAGTWHTGGPPKRNGRREIDQASTIRSLAAALGVFAQNDWRVSARLTINLGLGWDLDTPRHEGINNRQNSFDENALNPVCNCRGNLGRSGQSIYAHNIEEGMNITARACDASRPKPPASRSPSC